MNSPKPLPENNLCAATLSFFRAIGRQNADAEIPFLRTKIPFPTPRSLEYRQTSVHPRSYYTTGSTTDSQVSPVASRGLEARADPRPSNVSAEATRPAATGAACSLPRSAPFYREVKSARRRCVRPGGDYNDPLSWPCCLRFRRLSGHCHDTHFRRRRPGETDGR